MVDQATTSDPKPSTSKVLDNQPRAESPDKLRESMEIEFIEPLFFHTIPENTSWMLPRILPRGVNQKTSIVQESQRSLRSTLTNANTNPANR